MMGLPIWFRATSVLLFGALFAAYLAARGEPVARANEHGIAGDDLPPAVAPPPSSFAAMTGSYRVNGVPVRAERLRVPDGRPLDRLERALADAGYVTHRRSIAGHPAVLGLHPETHVLVTGSVEGDPRGAPVLRLAEHRLGARRGEAERDELPIPPGAESVVVLEPGHGARPLTSSFVLAEPPARASRRVAEALAARGWERRLVTAPDAEEIDFERRGERAVVLARATPDGRRSVVWIEIDESSEERR